MDTLLDIFDEIEKHGIRIIETEMVGNLKAVYMDSYIFIQKGLSRIEQRSVLQEELNHHKYDYGNILEKKTTSIKCENRTRRRTYEQILPINKIKRTLKNCHDVYELADDLDVTLEFLLEALEYYEARYGIRF